MRVERQALDPVGLGLELGLFSVEGEEGEIQVSIENMMPFFVCFLELGEGKG